VTPEIDLSKLSPAEKDALILSLLPLVGQLEAALSRIAELEQRLAAFERPPKTPDNSSLPPSKGQKANRPTGDKPPRKSRPGFGRALGSGLKLDPPDDEDRQGNGGTKVSRQLIVSGGDPTPILQM